MTSVLTHVLVFRTDASQLTDKTTITAMLGGHPEVAECSLDLEDVDRVLRVVSPSLAAGQIIEIMNQKGFQCQELE